MKNKGFTLIELIAVIVMMGMILLIVFPATSRLMRSNENKKYDNYYDAVQEELELYARTRRDELGGIKGAGCVEDKKLSDLKQYDYISEYKESKDVTCLSPGDFTTDRLEALGIDTSKDYVDIRIDNNKGKISVKFSLICVRNYEVPEKTSILYKKLIEKEDICNNYTPVVTNSLLNEIKSKYTVDTVDGISYVTDNPTNNYVLYSGKMWRIISYNSTERTIKLALDEVVSLIKYNYKKEGEASLTNNYIGSNILWWLENVFLPTLRNTDKYLEKPNWNYSATVANVTNPINGGNTVQSKVGLINNYEYYKSKSILNSDKNYWLLSTNGADSAWYVDKGGNIVSSTVSNYFGVKPAIVLKPNTTFVNGGTGTVDNPYRLIGDNSANIGTKLNDRIPGEYVLFKGLKYRISSVDPKYTKLIATSTITLDASIVSTIPHIVASNYNVGNSTIEFHYFDKVYSDNTFIGDYLQKWAQPLGEALTEGDFCRMLIDNTKKEYTECPQGSVINTKVAIPRLGDLYVVSTNSEYWTMNNSEELKMNVVTTGTSEGLTSVVVSKVIDPENTSITDKKSAILPVIVIDNDVQITGGLGTDSNPYTIE